LAACEEPVLSLSEESHEAIPTFCLVGAKSELTALCAALSASRTVNGGITLAGVL